MVDVIMEILKAMLLILVSSNTDGLNLFSTISTASFPKDNLESGLFLDSNKAL